MTFVAAGLLDDPLPEVGPVQHGSTLQYAAMQHVKVAVFGRSGVGKTSTVAKLCGMGELRHFVMTFFKNNLLAV